MRTGGGEKACLLGPLDELAWTEYSFQNVFLHNLVDEQSSKGKFAYYNAASSETFKLTP
jgi:hypothetical protein